MRAVKQPSPPALHHAPVTSPVGSSQLLICCLELASGGLASVKPLSDKIQVLSSLSPRFSTWTNGLFCLRHGHCCWQTRRHPRTRVCEYTLSDSGLGGGGNMPRRYTPTQARRLRPLPPPLPPSETQKMYDSSAAWRLLLRTPTIPGVCNKWCVYCGKEHSGMAHGDGFARGLPMQQQPDCPAKREEVWTSSVKLTLSTPWPYFNGSSNSAVLPDIDSLSFRLLIKFPMFIPLTIWDTPVQQLGFPPWAWCHRKMAALWILPIARSYLLYADSLCSAVSLSLSLYLANICITSLPIFQLCRD